MSALYLILGIISFIVGIIGIFVPLLPTTPFLLLAAYCFSRGSPRVHAWLISHPWFGPPIRDWNQHRAIRTRYKVLATVMVTGSMICLYYRPLFPVAGQAAFGLLMTVLLVFVWTRPSGS